MTGLYRGICYWQIKGSDKITEKSDRKAVGTSFMLKKILGLTSSQIRRKVQYNFIVSFSTLKLGASRDNYFIIQE